MPGALRFGQLAASSLLARAKSYSEPKLTVPLSSAGFMHSTSGYCWFYFLAPTNILPDSIKNNAQLASASDAYAFVTEKHWHVSREAGTVLINQSICTLWRTMNQQHQSIMQPGSAWLARKPFLHLAFHTTGGNELQMRPSCALQPADVNECLDPAP